MLRQGSRLAAMANFDVAVAVLLAHEGGFADDPSDAGGATKYGISLRWLASQGKLGDFTDDGHVDINDIRAMTSAQAMRIYREHWWERYRLGELSQQVVATKLLDLMVNMGPHQATLLGQDICRLFGHLVIRDGVLGAQTRVAIGAINADWFVAELRVRAADFYRLLIHRDARHAVFLNGWLARAYT